MSKEHNPLETILSGISPSAAARMLNAIHAVSARAQEKFGVTPTLAELIELSQVRLAVTDDLELDVENALFNLERSSATVKAKLAEQGATTAKDDGGLTVEDLAGFNPAQRMALARKLDLDGPSIPEAVSGPSALIPDETRNAMPKHASGRDLSPAERIAWARGQS